ncbi:lytic transglycosylase domain-containing protein [Parablautia muri]|nr:lytic transglycosylase domain-containing protein [Parablautia muri]
MELWKILAAVMAALILMEAVIMIPIMLHAQEAVKVPESVLRISEELGAEYHLCPETLRAVGWVESRFDPEAENDGCIGVMQVSEKWHKDRMAGLGVTDLKDIRGNMKVAADYLSELVNDGEDLEVALMRYHGESRVMERLSEGELSEYVAQVLEISAMLEYQHGK